MRLLLPSIASLVFVGGCVVTDSSLEVSNRSDFEIHEMYVTDINSPTWGDILLRGEILYPGDSMSLAISCGTYDTMLIDETDAVCEVHEVDLCFDNADWIIRNDTCRVFEEARAAAAKTNAAKSATDATTK